MKKGIFLEILKSYPYTDELIKIKQEIVLQIPKKMGRGKFKSMSYCQIKIMMR